MSKCLFISVRDPQNNLKGCFDEKIDLIDITKSPIGKLLISGKKHEAAYFIAYGDSSTDLLRDRDDKYNLINLGLKGIQTACSKFKFIRIYLHWASKSVFIEDMRCVRKVKIKIDEFCQLYPNLEYDIIYLISQAELA